MKRLMKIAAACALLLVANGAFAQDYVEDTPDDITDYGLGDNTDAGTTVSNTATVVYEVNGIEQAAEVNDPAAEFVVDRVILVNVANTDATNQVEVTPEATDQYLTFTVTNNSNATLDLVLELDQTGGDFDATSLAVWLEDGTTVGFQDTEDTQLTVTGDGLLLAGMAEEDVATVYVVGDIPDSATVSDGDLDDVVLLATAYENDGLGTTAVVETNVGTANEVDPMIEDTVFGDLAGDFDDGVDADTDEDGEHSDTGSFLVGSATITVTKTSVVISDPFNGTTNPKAIPGAEILYCIEVANTGGSDADNVSIKDPIPTGTTYVDESIEVFTAGVTCAAGLVSTGKSITDDDSDAAAEDLVAPLGVSGNSGDTGNAETTDTVVNTTVSTVGATTGVTATIFRVTID